MDQLDKILSRTERESKASIPGISEKLEVFFAWKAKVLTIKGTIKLASTALKKLEA